MTNYQGLPCYTNRGELNPRALQTLYQTLQNALNEHPRTIALRVDLRLPGRLGLGEGIERDMLTHMAKDDPEAISRFFASLNAKLGYDQAKRRKEGKDVRPSTLRYFWARELGKEGKYHYHVLLLMNNDTYHHSMGEPGSSMATRIRDGWHSALATSQAQFPNLIHIPVNAVYRVKANDRKSIEALFYRATYLCKLDTKEHIHQLKTYGSSLK